MQGATKWRCVQVSPEEIRPFPKVGRRKRTATNAGRKRGETRILADTPVKQQIERDTQARRMKKGNNKRKRQLFEAPNESENATAAYKKKKKSDGIRKKRAHVLNEKSRVGDDHCGVCSVAYGDNTDKKSHEEWLQCSGCAKWFHDSCAQSYGVVDDDETFTCYDCLWQFEIHVYLSLCFLNLFTSSACELGMYSQLLAKITFTVGLHCYGLRDNL